MGRAKAKAHGKQPANPVSNVLNRFTTLPILLDLLVKREITLLDPGTWEDTNDAFYIQRYRDKMKFLSVLAICFSLHRETFHHWRVFSHGSSGVCIEFDKGMLLNSIPANVGFRHQEVTYRTISDLQTNQPDTLSWPFLKRKPFEDESEYRLIFESKNENLIVQPIPIDLTSITRITLSPWVPSTVAESVIGIIHAIPGCDGLNVVRSSLIDNVEWKEVITAKQTAKGKKRKV